jgi:hypothetical protein
MSANFVGVPAGFGIVDNKHIVSVTDTASYPICIVLLEFIRRRVAHPVDGVNTKSFEALLQCCEDPHPPASNIFLRYM